MTLPEKEYPIYFGHGTVDYTVQLHYHTLVTARSFSSAGRMMLSFSVQY